MTKVNQELIAFWKYHNGDYETLLGEIIEKFGETGNAYVPNYQMWVRPVMILPLQEGREFLGILKDTEYQFKREKENLIKKYKERVQDFIDKRVSE
jgi:hypothetical protein